MAVIDLNADLGEGMGDDAGMLRIVTSANVACGAHAGDTDTMRSVCGLAARLGVRVGAHISYEDRSNFGRTPMAVAPEVLAASVRAQLERLSDVAAECGTEVTYLKPHGALYHQVAVDPIQAEAVLGATGTLAVMGLARSRLLELATAAGRTTIVEGFPDRGYRGAHRLIPRGEPGALIEGADQIAANAVALAAGVDSLCLHGDAPDAVASAGAVRQALETAGYDVRTW